MEAAAAVAYLFSYRSVCDIYLQWCGVAWPIEIQHSAAAAAAAADKIDRGASHFSSSSSSPFIHCIRRALLALLTGIQTLRHLSLSLSPPTVLRESERTLVFNNNNKR